MAKDSQDLLTVLNLLTEIPQQYYIKPKEFEHKNDLLEVIEDYNNNKKLFENYEFESILNTNYFEKMEFDPLPNVIVYDSNEELLSISDYHSELKRKLKLLSVIVETNIPMEVDFFDTRGLFVYLNRRKYIFIYKGDKLKKILPILNDTNQFLVDSELNNIELPIKTTKTIPPASNPPHTTTTTTVTTTTRTKLYNNIDDVNFLDLFIYICSIYMFPNTHQTIPHSVGYQYIIFQFIRKYSRISSKNQLRLKTNKIDKFLQDRLYRWISESLYEYVKFLVERQTDSLRGAVTIPKSSKQYSLNYQFPSNIKYIVLCTYKKKKKTGRFSITSPLPIFNLKLEEYLLLITDVRDNLIGSNIGGIIMAFSTEAPDDLINILNKNIEMIQFDRNIKRLYYIDISNWTHTLILNQTLKLRKTLFKGYDICGLSYLNSIYKEEMKDIVNRERELKIKKKTDRKKHQQIEDNVDEDEDEDDDDEDDEDDEDEDKDKDKDKEEEDDDDEDDDDDDDEDENEEEDDDDEDENEENEDEEDEDTSIKSPRILQQKYLHSLNKTNTIWMIGRNSGCRYNHRLSESINRQLEQLISLFKWITFNGQRNDLPTSQLDISTFHIRYILEVVSSYWNILERRVQIQKFFSSISNRDVVIVKSLDRITRHSIELKQIFQKLKDTFNILFIIHYYSGSYAQGSYVIDFGLEMVFKLVETSKGIKYQVGIIYEQYISNDYEMNYYLSSENSVYTSRYWSSCQFLKKVHSHTRFYSMITDALGRVNNNIFVGRTSHSQRNSGTSINHQINIMRKTFPNSRYAMIAHGKQAHSVFKTENEIKTTIVKENQKNLEVTIVQENQDEEEYIGKDEYSSIFAFKVFNVYSTNFKNQWSLSVLGIDRLARDERLLEPIIENAIAKRCSILVFYPSFQYIISRRATLLEDLLNTFNYIRRNNNLTELNRTQFLQQHPIIEKYIHYIRYIIENRNERIQDYIERGLIRVKYDPTIWFPTVIGNTNIQYFKQTLYGARKFREYIKFNSSPLANNLYKRTVNMNFNNKNQ